MGQILVQTPVTSNGRDPVLDAEDKIIYKETILESAAQPILEKQNLKLPTHLNKKISVYTTQVAQAPKPINYGVWGLKKLQGELEERGLLYDEALDKTELVTILKNHDEASN